MIRANSGARAVALMALIFSTGAATRTAEQACAGLAGNLRACKPYSCQFERQLSSASAEKILARYAVEGRLDDNLCGYRVNIDGNDVFRCKLRPESLDTMARLVEMQLDGSYQKNKQKLIEAMKSGGPNADLSSLDPDFMKLNQAFAAIMTTDCAPQD